MTDSELLSAVKIGLFGSDAGTWRDGMLTTYIKEVKGYMKSAGVPQTVLDGDESAGCIMIGVNDLWNYSGGGVKFSPYFKERVVQLASGNRGDKS